MNILVITGSPRRNSSSSFLADRFIEGAKESGHNIFKFDAAFCDVHPCIGCEKCLTGKNDCIFNDDMTKLYPKIIEADLIVYTTPLYYHAATPQLLSVISRYHGIDDLIIGKNKKTILIVTGANPNPVFMNGIKEWYKTDIMYLGWKDVGTMYITEIFDRSDIEKTSYPEEAYNLGKNLDK